MSRKKAVLRKWSLCILWQIGDRAVSELFMKGDVRSADEVGCCVQMLSGLNCLSRIVHVNGKHGTRGARRCTDREQGG